MKAIKGLIFISFIALIGCQSNKDAEKLAKMNEELQYSSPSMYDMPSMVDYDKAAKLNVELGLSYLQQGSHARAKTKLLRALRLSPDLPDVHYAYGYYLETVGELVEAESSYLKAIKKAPKNGKAHNNYGTFLCRLGRYREAEKEFLEAIQDKNYARTGEVFENAGLCVLQIPDVPKAQAYFEKALRHDPNRYYAMLELAIIKFKQNDVLSAQSYYTQYSRYASPTKRSLLLGLRLAELTGNKDKEASLRLILNSKFPNATAKDLFKTSG